MNTQLNSFSTRILTPIKPLTFTLVQYKGGGYDGCHWEWNFFYFDSNGKFHDIFSSGHSGLDNEKDARAYMKTTKRKSGYSWRVNEYYKYNLAVKSHRDKFQDESAESLVLDVGVALDKIEGKVMVRMHCGCCEDDIDIDSSHTDYPIMIHTGERGNGGIGIITSDYVCTDCFCNNSCGHCGEFMTDNDYANVPEIADNVANKHAYDFGMVREFAENLDECEGPLDKYCFEDELIKKLEAHCNKSA